MNEPYSVEEIQNSAAQRLAATLGRTTDEASEARRKVMEKAIERRNSGK